MGNWAALVATAALLSVPQEYQTSKKLHVPGSIDLFKDTENLDTKRARVWLLPSQNVCKSNNLLPICTERSACWSESNSWQCPWNEEGGRQYLRQICCTSTVWWKDCWTSSDPVFPLVFQATRGIPWTNYLVCFTMGFISDFKVYLLFKIKKN